MKERYKIVYQGGEGEIVEKKSRFIAEIRPVESEEEATAFIAEVKKANLDTTSKETEPERAETERVEAEIVYSPMVTEPQEYQYNADAFEARGVDEVKQEAAHKEASKVREDKAR